MFGQQCRMPAMGLEVFCACLGALPLAPAFWGQAEILFLERQRLGMLEGVSASVTYFQDKLQVSGVGFSALVSMSLPMPRDRLDFWSGNP